MDESYCAAETCASEGHSAGRRKTDMPMPSALEIARQATLKPVTEIAEDIGIPPWLIEPYGEFVAKIGLGAIEALAGRPRARYVVVTAVTPTPLGEGKTTTTIGLGQAMRHIGKRATISIRQASMGPTFGIKGGAAGRGLQPGSAVRVAEPAPDRRHARGDGSA
jgi:formyltetrahydrofolate synthetase